MQWEAVINGETETGITTMLMDEGMDTGAMLLREKLEILPRIRPALAPRLARAGWTSAHRHAHTVKRRNIGADKTRRPAGDDGPAPQKEDGLINWTLSATSLANPGARAVSLAWGLHISG